MTSGSSITLRPNGWSPISSLHATAYQVLRKYSMLTPSPARARLWIRVRATTFLSPGPCRANQAASRARSIGFPRATFFQLSDISQLLHSKDCEFQLFWCKRSEEHTSELQSLMRISYAVFCLKKKIQKIS